MYVLGDITKKGFLLAQAQLWKEYMIRLKQDGKVPVRAPQGHNVLSLDALKEGNLNKTLRLQDQNIHKSVDDHKKGMLKVEEREHGDKDVQKKEYGKDAILKYVDRVKQKDLDLDLEHLAGKEGPGNVDAGLPELVGQNFPANVIPRTNDGVKKSVGGGGVDVKLQPSGGNKTVQFKTRRLKAIDWEDGFLPWEKEGIFDSVQKVGCGDAFSTFVKKNDYRNNII